MMVGVDFVERWNRRPVQDGAQNIVLDLLRHYPEVPEQQAQR